MGVPGSNPGGPINFVSQKCCLTDLAFGFMPLERTDETLLHHFWVSACLRFGASGGDSQNIDSHLGRGSLHDDDGTVVARAGVRESTRKGQRGGALEKGRRSDVAGGEEHDHRVS